MLCATPDAAGVSGMISENVRMNLTFRHFDVMNTGKSILAFVAGAAAGAVAALLLAPDSGEKTRDKLRSKAAGATGIAKEKILEGLDALENALEDK